VSRRALTGCPLASDELIEVELPWLTASFANVDCLAQHALPSTPCCFPLGAGRGVVELRRKLGVRDVEGWFTERFSPGLDGIFRDQAHDASP